MTKASEKYPEIVGLIRAGRKTSEIIALGKWSVDVVKAVKSEELENDKKVERANLEARQQISNQAREKRQNERFMAKYKMKYAVVKDVVAPAETETSGPAPSGDVTVQAPALGADTQQ